MTIETNTDTSEPLGETWWQGRQWAVTEFGIERRDGTYHMEGETLAETRSGLGDAPLHMSEKEWVDIEDFCTAWLVALLLHGHGAAFTPDVLRETCDEAIREAHRARQIEAIMDKNHPPQAGLPGRVWNLPDYLAAHEEAEAELDERQAREGRAMT